MTEETVAAPKPIDVRSFWSVLGQRPVGITIVTAKDTNGPAGLLGLSAAHVSADPPTMLVSVDDKTSALATILASRAFAINYLGKGARDIATIFGGKSDLKGADRFEAGKWTSLQTGSPIAKEALGAFDCVLEDVIQRGSTSILIGRVVDFSVKSEGDPLVFFRGKIQD